MALARLPRSFAAIREAAHTECTSISLGQLLRGTGADAASLRHSARWLQRQLPIRFARRIEDMLRLPHVVVSNPHIGKVLSAYVETFDKLSEFREVCTEEDEAGFFALVREQIDKHIPGTRLIAEGYRDVLSTYPDMQLDDFLDNLFITRVATRILMDNYVTMRTPRDGYLGVVCQGMRPLDIVKGIVLELSDLSCSIYGCAPEVEYLGNLDCILDYIPRHVLAMVRELLKNAFRATIERHLQRSGGGSSPLELPHVVVELQQGDVHVIIKISDQGGGIPKRDQPQAWRYGWTTDAEMPGAGRREAWQYTEESCSWERGAGSPARPSASAPAGPEEGASTRLHGSGFGLPLTRLHAQYFGGDVLMQALPGHGTNMYLLLAHLKAGTPSTEIDDLSTELYAAEEQVLKNSANAP